MSVDIFTGIELFMVISAAPRPTVCVCVCVSAVCYCLWNTFTNVLGREQLQSIISHFVLPIL